MAIFQTSVLKKYLQQQDQDLVTKAYKKYTKYFHDPSIQQNIRDSKEEQYQAKFLDELFVHVLGYTLNPQPKFNLTTEFKNISNSRKADGAILLNDAAIAVIELKGTNTKDLESIRQQAFDYKANQPECVYVITSNFEKLRFYINNAVDFEEFDLFALSYNRFELLYLCLHKDHLLKHVPLKIKEASIHEEEAITKKFYSDYSNFKRELFRDMVKRNLRNPALKELGESSSKKELFKKTQKLLDRFLFIFFGEDRGLLPPNSIPKILEQWESLKKMDAYTPLYERYKKYFGYLNEGWKGQDHEIFAYNGGLFKPDVLLDTIDIDDELLFKHTSILTKYDFESQVDVNILGHIFEHSLNEIESVNAEIEGVEFDKQKSKRKKDGVFYTPKYITKYIVDNTVGKLCEEKKAELDIREEEYLKGPKNRAKTTLQQLDEKLTTYRNWLLELTICDPACGSGAFLNQALDFLITEHRWVDEMSSKLIGGGFIFPDIENSILEKNIYGVDLNDESVEIAKLSLWLRTAQKGRKLTSLNSNIKCGNSLIDSKAVAGDKAFSWEKEFPDVFAKGGFDVIIGNPPYVQHRRLFEFSFFFKDRYDVYTGTSDLSVYFFEKGLKIMKNNGFLGFINTNKFFNSEYGKPLRDFLASYRITEIINFERSSIFADALVSSVILIASKSSAEKEVSYLEFLDEKIDAEKFESQLIKRITKFPNEYLLNNSWMFENPLEKKIIDKIKLTGKEFKNIEGVKINRGITTGFDNAFIIDNYLYSDFISKDSKVKEILPPLLKGRNIKKYFIEDSSLWLLNSHNGLRNYVDPIDLKSDYPVLFEHLLNANTEFEGKVENRSDKGIHWTNLRNCAFLNEFDKKKIVWGLISSDLEFALDYKKHYLTSASYFLTSEKIPVEVFLLLMNSSLFKFYFTKVGEMTAGGAFVLKKASIEKFVLSNNIDSSTYKNFISKSEKISYLHSSLNIKNKAFKEYLSSQFKNINLTKKLQSWFELNFSDFIKELNKGIKTAGGAPLTKMDEMEWMELFEAKKKEALELKAEIDRTDREIDQMVYELYELTDEEIQIVENS